jgi:hypothetical protein
MKGYGHRQIIPAVARIEQTVVVAIKLTWEKDDEASSDIRLQLN